MSGYTTHARNVRARTDKKLFSPFTAVAQINNADNGISGIPKNTRLSRVFVTNSAEAVRLSGRERSPGQML